MPSAQLVWGTTPGSFGAGDGLRDLGVGNSTQDGSLSSPSGDLGDGSELGTANATGARSSKPEP